MARIKKAKAHRRLRGEGSVYAKQRSWQTKGGRRTATQWVAVTPEARKGPRRYFTARTADEARRKRDEWLAKHGKPVAGKGKPTVAEFAEVFVAQRKASRKPATARDYETTLKHITPLIGSVRIADLTDEQCKDLYRTLDGKVSPSMRKRCHVTLRAMLNYALECKIVHKSRNC
jgi:Phage integrase SAM-like domain